MKRSFARSTNYDGIPWHAAYPHFIRPEDAQTVNAFCAEELAAWRSAAAQLHAEPSIDRKLRRRGTLETAFARLKNALNNAKRHAAA